MPGTNLTRDEAHQRAATISTESYDVELDLTLDNPDRFGSITTIRFSASSGGATFADLVDGDIRSITLNGDPVDVSAYSDSRIALTGLAESNELRVEATCRYSHSGEGLHKFTDPADEKVYLYTQFEVPDARRVFTTFEQPDLKAVFTFHVTAPDDWAVVSNSPTPDPVPAHDGAATWHFEPTGRCRPTSPPSWPGTITASATPTPATTQTFPSASTVASRWSSTLTPTTSS